MILGKSQILLSEKINVGGIFFACINRLVDMPIRNTIVKDFLKYYTYLIFQMMILVQKKSAM